MSEETKEIRNIILKKDIHFTYKDCLEKDSLCQGDVLDKTDGLTEVLQKAHPYFLNEEYKQSYN